MSKQHSKRLKLQQGRGIYLLPNLITTAGLFAGFYALIAAMKGKFDVAALSIFIAIIADGLDGRVARLTQTQSAFGAEYDSLADMVAFGIAPAVLAYKWCLFQLGKPGWIMAFCYAVAGALRLARFNSTSHNHNKRYFIGLPIPAAALIIAAFIGTAWEFKLTNVSLIMQILTGIITVAVALGMVSNVCYLSFKDMDFKGKVPFITILLVVLIYIAISFDPPLVLFVIFGAYGVSGPIMWLSRRLRRKRLRQLASARRAEREQTNRD